MVTRIESIARAVVLPLLLAVFYRSGRLLLRALTGGRLPPAGKPHDVERVALVAIAVFLFALAVHHQ